MSLKSGLARVNALLGELNLLLSESDELNDRCCRRRSLYELLCACYAEIITLQQEINKPVTRSSIQVAIDDFLIANLLSILMCLRLT
jgi:hypothetical protein